MRKIVIFGRPYTEGPYYGEIEYQYRMSMKGWKDRNPNKN